MVVDRKVPCTRRSYVLQSGPCWVRYANDIRFGRRRLAAILHHGKSGCEEFIDHRQASAHLHPDLSVPSRLSDSNGLDNCLGGTGERQLEFGTAVGE